MVSMISLIASPNARRGGKPKNIYLYILVGPNNPKVTRSRLIDSSNMYYRRETPLIHLKRSKRHIQSRNVTHPLTHRRNAQENKPYDTE